MKVIFRVILAVLVITSVSQLFSMDILKYLGYPYQKTTTQQLAAPVTDSSSRYRKFLNC